jgi:hypothetical protein
MSAVLPTVEHLATLLSAPAQTDWLFRAPDAVYVRSFNDIRAVLLATEFDAAVIYARVRLAAACAVRTEDGRYTITIEKALAIAALDMRVAAAARGD